MKKNEFQCADCGGIFKKGLPDKVAWREYDDNFPGASHQIAEIICDDCYQKMIAVEPPPEMKEKRIGYGWLHLKLARPWWWKLLHPIKTRVTKKWMREVEPGMRQELEKMNFNKLIKKMLYDQICYGTSAVHVGTYGISPAQVAMKDIKLMNEVRGVWRKMDIRNTHKDIIETEIKKKEKP